MWIGLCVVLSSGLAAARGAPAARIGEKVETFERADSQGKTVRLAEALKSGRAVVIDFWSSRCPVSERYEPVLKKLATEYAQKGVVFLAVDANYNEPAEEIERVRRDRGVTVPVLMDGAEGKLAAYFAASHTPEAYLLGKDGKLVYHGNLDELGGALDAVLSGKPVPKAETRAFGCSIKRP